MQQDLPRSWALAQSIAHNAAMTTPAVAPEPVDDGDLDYAQAGRFETAVAIAMVLAAILGALIAWRASVVSENASGLFDLAAQQRAEREQVLATIDLWIDHDVRLARQYGDHVHAQTSLSTRSEEAGSPALAAQLDRRAREEQMYARTLSAHFLAQFPAIDEEGRVTYDRQRAERSMLASSRVADIRPEATFQTGQDNRGLVVRLIGVAFVTLCALFLLTLAQLLEGSRLRRLLAGSGGVLFTAAAVLFVIVGAA